LKVIRKDKLNHDSYLYVLQFPNPDWIAGCYPGGHFFFHAEVNGKPASKRYTPISPVNEKGQVQFIIKIYREHPDFPGKGHFTRYLENNVNVGDSIMCEGPTGKTKYEGNGKFIMAK
jgi:ferredoxin-NADP reductase